MLLRTNNKIILKNPNSTQIYLEKYIIRYSTILLEIDWSSVKYLAFIKIHF